MEHGVHGTSALFYVINFPWHCILYRIKATIIFTGGTGQMLSILQLYTNFNDSANIETIITWYPHHKNHHCLLLPVPSLAISDIHLFSWPVQRPQGKIGSQGVPSIPSGSGRTGDALGCTSCAHQLWRGKWQLWAAGSITQKSHGWSTNSNMKNHNLANILYMQYMW